MITFVTIMELRVRGTVNQQRSIYPLADHSFVATYEHRYSQSFQSMCHIYYGSLTSCHFISFHPSSPLYPYFSDYYNFCALSFSLGETETKTSQEPAVLASKLPAGEIDVVVQN